MPGPIIRNPTPAWMKPENASVMDPTVKKIARTLAQLVGMDDPQSQVLGMMNPTTTAAIGLVPRRSIADLIANVLNEGASPQAREAFTHLAERFPRVMSHVSTVDTQAPLNTAEEAAAYMAGDARSAISPRVQIGHMRPEGPARYASEINRGYYPMTREPVATIAIDDRVVPKTMTDHVDTLAHEMTHVGQNLRQTDRALRDSSQMPIGIHYDLIKQQAGYRGHPMEVAARVAGANKGNESSVINVARKMIGGGATPEEAAARIAKMFKSTGISDDYIRRNVRIAATMAKRAAE